MNNYPGVKWTTIVHYVDIETGLKLTPETGKNFAIYIITKTIKHVTLNRNKTRGTIEYTKFCKRQPQTKLFD